MKWLSKLLVLGLALAVIGVWLWPGERAPAPSPLEYRGQVLQSRTVVPEAGSAFELARGTITVPEVRSNATSRPINVGFAVVPKLADAGDVPVFLVAGGPGSSYIERIDETWLQQMIGMLRRVGDVVLVDLRGIGTSTPSFELKGVKKKLRRVADGDSFAQLLTDAGTAGRTKLIADGFDPRGYVVTEAAADIIAVADALSYPKIHMQGTSFGSHLTFTTVREYPQRIERFLVSGLEGYDHTFDDGLEVLKALRLIAQEAAPVWGGAHGVDNPLEAMQDLLARAEEDPKSAFGLEPHEVLSAFTSGRLFGKSYGLTHRNRMLSWPSEVDKLLSGEGAWRKSVFRNLAGFFVGRSASEAAVGLFDCSSWISTARRKRLEGSAPPAVPNDLAQMDALCKGWAVDPLPPAFQRGEISEVPALFIHGTYDVATPYANALEMLSLFPNATLTTVSGGSHGALTEAMEADKAFMDALVRWYGGGPPPSDVSLDPIPFLPLEATGNAR